MDLRLGLMLSTAMLIRPEEQLDEIDETIDVAAFLANVTKKVAPKGRISFPSNYEPIMIEQIEESAYSEKTNEWFDSVEFPDVLVWLLYW